MGDQTIGAQNLTFAEGNMPSSRPRRPKFFLLELCLRQGPAGLLLGKYLRIGGPKGPFMPAAGL